MGDSTGADDSDTVLTTHHRRPLRPIGGPHPELKAANNLLSTYQCSRRGFHVGAMIRQLALRCLAGGDMNRYVTAEALYDECMLIYGEWRANPNDKFVEFHLENLCGMMRRP